MHINKVGRSQWLDNYLFTVIVVNENYEIIDGQHRFDVIKIKTPFYICVVGNSKKDDSERL